MVPRAIFRDPFRGGDNILVMTDTYVPPRQLPDGSVAPIVPIPTNTRHDCAEAMEKVKAHEPWFGIEQVCAARRHEPELPCSCLLAWRLRMSTSSYHTLQEYTLLNATTKWPLGWPKGGYPAGQGPYYCAAGAGVSIARDVCEVHYRCARWGRQATQVVLSFELREMLRIKRLSPSLYRRFALY